MRLCPITMAVLLLLLSRTVSAQVRAEELRRTIEELRSAYTEFVTHDSVIRASTPGWDVQLKRMTRAIDWLNGRVSATDPAAVSREYLRSLQSVADLLKESKRTPSIATFRDLVDELEAKVDHCRLLGVGMGGLVLLKVNTQSPAGPVGNWQVVYLLKIYEHERRASPNNFPRLSTPTEEALEPGRYWVWARDPATGRTSERMLVRVVGHRQLLVDLPVP